MGKDSIMAVLKPAAVVLIAAVILIYILGCAFGVTPEFLEPFHEWLRKPVAEAKVGHMLLAILIISILK